MDNIKLHKILDDYLHKIVALNEIIPFQMQSAFESFTNANDSLNKKLEEYGKPISHEDGSSGFEVSFKHARLINRLSAKRKQAHLALEILPKSFLVTFVSEYDSFLGQLNKYILKEKPELLKAEQKTITFEELNALNSIEEAREKIINQEIESLLRDSHSKQFDWMENKYSLTLKKGLESWSNFIELTERRNLFVHCNGIVSEQYLKKCHEAKYKLDDECKVGKKLYANKEYIELVYKTLFEISLKLTQVLWRKQFPTDIEHADDSLSNITYELLINEEYELASILLDFACDVLKKWSSESQRLVFVINRAISYKFSDKDFHKILDTQDWSACKDSYQLCAAVLKDEFELAKRYMVKVGKSEEISEVSFLEWPCFRNFRETEFFNEAFFEIFGKQPYYIENIETETETETDTDTETDTETDDLYFIKENNKEKAALQPRSQAKEPKRTKETEAAIPTSFQIPDVGQVEAYCRELGLQVDAAGFVDYYQAKGWMLGTNPMQDWQAAVRSWNRRRDKNYAQSEITLPYPIGVQL